MCGKTCLTVSCKAKCVCECAKIENGILPIKMAPMPKDMEEYYKFKAEAIKAISGYSNE